MWLTGFVSALTLALGQASSQPYVGTWIAEFQGQTFVRVELSMINDRLAGRIGVGDIEVNAAGEVTKAASVPTRLSAISDVVVRDSILSFSRRDGNDTDQFKMNRVGEDAELLFLPSDEDRRELAAAGVPVPKPIRLRRLVK